MRSDNNTSTILPRLDSIVEVDQTGRSRRESQSRASFLAPRASSNSPVRTIEEQNKENDGARDRSNTVCNLTPQENEKWGVFFARVYEGRNLKTKAEVLLNIISHPERTPGL